MKELAKSILEMIALGVGFAILCFFYIAIVLLIFSVPLTIVWAVIKLVNHFT